LRRAPAASRLRNSDRYARGHDARLRRGRLPGGGADLLRLPRRGPRPGAARGPKLVALRETAAVSRVPRLHLVRRVSIDVQRARGTVTEVTHPLVRHKLGLLRDRETSTAD